MLPNETPDDEPRTSMVANESEAPLRDDGFNTAAHASLPWFCWTVAGLLLARCAFHASYPIENWMAHTLPLVIAAAMTAVFLAGYGAWLRRGGLAGWSADSIALMAFLPVLATSLIPVALDPRPFRYVTIAFCVVGAGCVFLSRRHLAFALLCCLVGWFVCTAPLWPDPTWVRLTAVLLSSVPLALLIAEFRRAGLMRLASSNRVAEENRAAAERANEVKTRFLANTSHELRTPLTAILGYAELLTSGDAVDLTDATDRIHRNARHLLRLVDDLLDLSRIESDRLELKLEIVSPGDVARQAVESVAIEADAKGLDLQLLCGPSVPDGILSDATRLRQVLVNLLGNAVKFTETGTVTLRIDVEQNAQLVFEVADTGIGIPACEIEAIFDPFRQADSSSTRERGGTGLGLSISRRIAEALDGRLSVRSAIGHGSTFRLEVPIRTSPSEAGASRAFDASGSSREDDPGNPTALATTASVASLTDRRVLVVDDGEEIRLLVSHYLRKAGVDVECDENGREAVDRILRDESRFDLVLMDLQMPVLDGYAAVAALRASGYAGRVVALTASAFFEDRDRCIAGGFDDYLTKPFSRSALIETVARNAEFAAAPGEAGLIPSIETVSV